MQTFWSGLGVLCIGVMVVSMACAVGYAIYTSFAESFHDWKLDGAIGSGDGNAASHHIRKPFAYSYRLRMMKFVACASAVAGLVCFGMAGNG